MSVGILKIESFGKFSGGHRNRTLLKICSITILHLKSANTVSFYQLACTVILKYTIDAGIQI